MRGIYKTNFCNSVGASLQNSSRGTVLQICFSLQIIEVTDTVVLTTDNIRHKVLNCRQVCHFAEEVRW